MELKGFFITEENMPQFVNLLAKQIKQELLGGEVDEYLTPEGLSEKIPALSKNRIKCQIRAGHYGKKIGAKGTLVAKVSEAKKYNRI